ncbi:ankyrin repeat and KH domain-containing protein 1-like isoform X3 [Mytilus galloprovincialis]|uniref:ankyrin repeat and KH domain-containing protein 1-like isoform X3 n=1 Tax=Mytilus galloprovincialis TaxID=29158 RepID=UPI003F7BF659
MQNGNQDDNSEENNEMRTVEIEQGSQTGSSSEEKSDNAPTAQSTFGPDISASDDDDNSDIGSFIMDNEIDDDQDLEPTKFLLPTEGMENANIPSIDPETHARLEALLEAAGIGKLSTADGKALTDPEVLRKLTSSVSCALDEAAQALHRMRAEQQGQIAGAEGCRSLAEACSDGDVPTVRKLLHEGGSVHETTEEGESLLSLACSAGYYELAQVLLAMKANVEDRGIKGDCTPLMEAASGGYVDIVKLLISHGADVNAQSSAGNTPLHYAACGGYEDVVQVLIEAGANVEQHNENGHTPLMESASAGHVGVARILLNAGAGINTHSNEFKESALTLACYKGHLEMVKFLLEAGADQEHKTDEMHTALMEASMDGHVEVARLLLDSGAQVNMPADSFESPLTLAACGGHVELASLLIERGANLEEVNDEGYTPLMEAAREGHEEMVALLLAHGADINAQTEETQETALTLACCGGFLDVADFLIKAGADYELGCSTPLMEAAQEGHLELVKYLLKAGSNVHAQTGTGDTALTYACENGHTDVAEVLLQHGAELEHESEGGRTPLMKAARAGYLCTVQFLISKGADVNRATSTNDHTVLSLACAGGHLAVVELLLAHGADFIHKLKDGSTMIIEAAKGGHTQVVKLLLEPPNRVLMNGSPELELLPEPQHLNEARVPTQGLGNIVPPSNPDSSTCANANFITVPPGTQNLSKKPLEKEFNIAARNNEPQILKNMQNSIKRSHNNNNGGGKVSKPSPNTTATLSTTVENVASNLEQEPDNMESDHTVDVKATERLEAIINNVMANELDNSASTREEQILRKQQILQELQKVEKELQEKAQAQLILSAHHQLEQQQQQQQLHQVLQQGAKALQNKLDAQVKRKQDELTSPDDLTLEELCIESSVDPEPSNDLDKQISNILTTDGSTAVGQIVFPNIPYDGVIPVTSSQQVEEGSQAMDNKELWARNNGNTPKRNVNKVTRTSRNNQIVTSTTSTVTTSSSIVNGILTPDQENAIAQGIPQIANPGSLTLAAYKQQIQTLSVRQQQQQQQIQVQQQQTQTIQFPQLTLTPEQQEQLLQMLSQPNFAAQQQLASQHIPIAGQQIVQQQTIGQQISQLQPYIQQQLQQQPQTVQALPQAFIPQPLIQPHLISPQQLSQQQQQQLLQQQQQAQLLQQQLQQQIKQPPPVPPATMPKNQRPKRHLYNNQTVPGMQGLETITPPPSTPLTPNPSPASPQSISPLCAPVDLDSQTESNHDTALTLACHGGHAELVSLLLSKGADIEHRDKKGFTPLILAATAGHVDVVEILLDHGADMEAQSERTKDTPLSLACSGGRFEVVELLLSRGANKEHRNVSDYTPLSLAASGGYVNIIKLLLSHGAEINSRTGSKLGISPLMLAAMNGHTAAVKLLLDMGSDINAQIETNRNTALTLACFQGRHEVVSLLVDRKANIEHRAKTGLTPLMEAASGGYVEVGRVLLDKGADVNAPPVPSSRDTALTIAADKGHYRFVELLLSRSAQVDVKNKKGNSPLWLACNGGHLDVVQLLVSAHADIDSQDNRKVSCLMAAFRKGHVKVVKWMVKHVNQFPSDQELSRYISTVQDKELAKKCQQSMEIIVSAKDRQAAEANKIASILLEELDKERESQEKKRAVAAKKREKKRQKKKEKQEKEKDPTTTKSSTPEPEIDIQEKDEVIDDIIDDPIRVAPPMATVTSTIGITLPIGNEPKYTKASRNKNNRAETTVTATESKKNKKNRREKEKPLDVDVPPVSICSVMTATPTIPIKQTTTNNSDNNNKLKRKKDRSDVSIKSGSTGIGDLDDFGTLPEKLKISDREVEKLRKSVEKTKISKLDNKHENQGKVNIEVVHQHKISPGLSSPKKGQKKEEGWKEVMRKSKRVQVSSSAISRVIGRSGCNINAIREVSGAHIEVEKQKGNGGERVITIKGPPEGTKQAHALIMALVSDPEKELNELIPKYTNKQPPQKESMYFSIDTSVPTTSSVSSSVSSTVVTSSSRSSGGGRSGLRSQASNVRLATLPASIGVWGGPPTTSTITSPRRNQQKSTSSIPAGLNQDKNVTRQLFPMESKKPIFSNPPTTSTNNSLTYTFACSSSKVTTSPSPIFSASKLDMPRSPGPPMVKVLQRPPNQKNEPLPIVSNQQQSMSNGPVQSTNAPHGTFSPFNNSFSNVADQFLKRDESAERMNFASVAAAGVVASMGNSPMSESSGLPGQMGGKSDAALQAKAPGYRPTNIRPMTPQEMEAQRIYNFVGMQGMQPVRIGVGENELNRAPGYRMPNQSPVISPRNQGELSPPSHSIGQLQPRKDEYTTPNQPLTLPKIESTLNPNAPDFTSRQPGQPQGQNIPPAMYLQSLYLAQLFNNQPGGPSNSPSMNPQSMISQQEFASLISQFVASGQAQGPPPPVPPSSGPGGFVPGPQNIQPRPFSPLQTGRPNSAPVMGVIPKVVDGSSPGPVPPSSVSPLPATPPPMMEPIKGDDRKHLRPIGGERAQRRAPGGPGQVNSMTNNFTTDYKTAVWNLASELSMQWNPVSSDVMTSVSNPPIITSSVISHGSPTPQMEDGPPPSLQNNTDFMNGPVDKSFESNVDMNFLKCAGNSLPPSFNPGPLGDHMPNMWNAPVKGQMSEPSDKGMWNSWSSQTSL